jgi:hypothetical protein
MLEILRRFAPQDGNAPKHFHAKHVRAVERDKKRGKKANSSAINGLFLFEDVGHFNKNNFFRTVSSFIQN